MNKSLQYDLLRARLGEYKGITARNKSLQYDVFRARLGE